MTKVAWIIGASFGIGRSVALKLAEEDYVLALSARNSKPLEALLKEFPKNNSHSIHPCDVSKTKTLQKAYENIIKTHKQLDLVIFAAGIYWPMPLLKYDHKKSSEILDVNLGGALNTFEVVKDFATSREHFFHLVWIASVAGYRGLPNACTYGVSKAGLINFAETQRIELKALNTKVQVVNPGFVKTRLTDKNAFEMPSRISSERAANYIVKGMKSSKFEISFPPLFSFIMKVFRLMPDVLFFSIAENIGKSEKK